MTATALPVKAVIFTGKPMKHLPPLTIYDKHFLYTQLFLPLKKKIKKNLQIASVLLNDHSQYQ